MEAIAISIPEFSEDKDSVHEESLWSKSEDGFKIASFH